MVAGAYCILQIYELRPGIIKERSFNTSDPESALRRYDFCLRDKRTRKITILFRYALSKRNKLTPIVTYNAPICGSPRERDFGPEIFERFPPAGNERPDMKQQVLI